jgi:hypothetical protein
MAVGVAWRWPQRFRIGRIGGSSAHGQAFTLDLLANLPRWIRLRLVRADSGFCQPEWLDLLEDQELCYIVVARLLRLWKAFHKASYAKVAVMQRYMTVGTLSRLHLT